MRPAGRCQVGVALLAALALAGCIELADFPESNIVAQPRALAIIAEPPEARPGQSVELSLLLSHGPDELDASDAEWIVCGEYFSFQGNNQYGDGESGEGCGDGDPRVGRGARVALPGLLSAALFANLDLAREVLGSSLPPNTIDLVRERVGLPVLVEARFEHAGKVIRTTKRVLVSERAQGNTNPPPPSFGLAVNGEDPVRVSALDDPERPFTCATESGATPVLPAREEVKLAPVFEGKQEPWLERYQVIDIRGDVHTRDENAFYSWYATGGDIGPRVTKPPDREASWQTPSKAGKHKLWLIVRDGHGGTSACALDVRVRE